MRATKSGWAPPPPVPAKSAVAGVPSRPRVPPKPYGLMGDSSRADVNRSGWSAIICMATPQPIECAATITGPPRGNRSRSSSSAARSSAKSRRPRVASTGAASLRPYPRRWGATTRTLSGSRRMSGSQYSADEPLPCTSRTGTPSCGRFHAASSTACPRSCGTVTAGASSRTRSRAERGCRRLYPSGPVPARGPERGRRPVIGDSRPGPPRIPAGRAPDVPGRSGNWSPVPRRRRQGIRRRCRRRRPAGTRPRAAGGARPGRR